jgi:hypothetical protein
MSAEQLNAALMIEFRRLGGRDGIDAVLKSFGVTGVASLQPAQYGDVLAQVRAL